MDCDLLERGLGLTHATSLLNVKLKKDNMPKMKVSCVQNTYQRLCPAIIPIRKVTMGTNDAHSGWAIALFNIAKQLAICIGVLDPFTTTDPYNKPSPLTIYSTVWIRFSGRMERRKLI